MTSRQTGRGSQLVLALLVLGATIPRLAAKVLLTQEEALALAFPAPATVERRTVFLTKAQLDAARNRARVPIESEVWTVYSGQLGGRSLGTAYFDTHAVRTLPETLMVVVGPEGRVERVEVLAFSEPPEYLPREAWYRQFPGKPLDGDLESGRAIRGVTGATLSARAATAAVRRVLAIDAVLRASLPSSPRSAPSPPTSAPSGP